ncbi:hypothetical protein OH492_23315 [Vibrio chagasii]|nr:hypothetical protein [Vibrio chagasii]
MIGQRLTLSIKQKKKKEDRSRFDKRRLSAWCRADAKTMEEAYGVLI